MTPPRTSRIGPPSMAAGPTPASVSTGVEAQLESLLGG
jgi:hypothetical protein